MGIWFQIVRPHVIDVLDAIALFGRVLVLSNVDILHAVADLRRRTWIAGSHAVSQNTVSDLLGVLVVIAQRLAENELLNRNSVVQNIGQNLLSERLRLLHSSAGQQDIQCTAEHVLHDRRIITALQHDTHGHALCLLRAGVLFVLHTDISLATEEDERIEGLFVGNLVRSATLLSDALPCLDSEIDRGREILCWELDEDGVCIAIDHLCPELGFNNALCEEEGLSSRCRGARGDTEFSDRRGSTSGLPVHRVCNHLIGELKAVINRSLSFVIFRIFHHLLIFLPLRQQNLQRLRKHTRQHRLICFGLDVGADGLSTRLLVVVLHLIQHVALRL